MFSQGDSRLNGLGDIPASLGFRGFVNYRLGPVMLGTVLTKFVADGNDGLLIDASIGVPWRIDDRLMVMGRLFTTWADACFYADLFWRERHAIGELGICDLQRRLGAEERRAGDRRHL